MASIIASNSDGRINVLRCGARKAARVIFFGLYGVSTIMTSLSFLGVVGAISRINGYYLANANKACGYRFLSQFYRRTSVLWSSLVQVMAGNGVFGASVANRENMECASIYKV